MIESWLNNMGYFKIMYNGNAYEYTGTSYTIHDYLKEKSYYREIENNVFYGKKIGEKSIHCELDKDGINTDWICVHTFIGHLCVTNKFKELIEKFNIGECEFIPIYSNNVIIGYLVNVLNIFDNKCVDEKKSKLTIFDHKKDVIKPAFKENVIQNLDLFSYKYGEKDYKRGIFISERLKRAIKKAKLTGCGFIYCESYK